MAGYETRNYAQGDGLYVEYITAGENIPRYSLVYLDGAGDWRLADANLAATMPVLGLATQPITATQKGRVLQQGYANYNVWTWTPGGVIYAGEVPGVLTQTKPTTAGVLVQPLGYARSTTLIYFDPKLSGEELSIADYEVQTGALAEPTVTSKGNGHVVAVYNSTQDILVYWIRGNGDTAWFRKGEETEASYIIWSDGLTPSTYYAKNGMSGVVTSDPSWETLAQSVVSLGGKTVFKGEFVKITIPAIEIPDDTEIEIPAGSSITLDDNIGDGATIFANDDPVGGNTGIIIHGEGILDGNKANQAVGEQVAVNFTEVSNSKVDIYMQNFKGYNIYSDRGVDDKGNTYINRYYPDVPLVSYYDPNPIVNKLFKVTDAWQIDDLTSDWDVLFGSREYDTSDYVVGPNSLKGTLAAGGAEPLRLYKEFATPLDLEGYNFGFWFKNIDGGNGYVTNLYFELQDTSNKVRQWRFADCERTLWDGDDIWSFHIINANGYYADTGCDISDIDTIRFKFLTGGFESIVKIDNFVAMPVFRSFPNGAVIMGFDGPYERQLDEGLVEMERYGFKGVVGTSMDSLTEADRGRVGELYRQGWDVVVYGRFTTGSPYTTYKTEAEMQDHLLGNKQWLLDNGWVNGARFVRANAQRMNRQSYNIMAPYFDLFQGESFLGEWMIDLPNFYLHTGTTTVAISKEYILDAIENKRISQFFVHLLDPVTEPEWDAAAWTSFVEWLGELHKDTGVEIITFSELYDTYLFNPPKPQQKQDMFMDVLAVSATHVRSNEDLSAATPITFTIDAQPDVPRTLSGHFDSHAQITAYTIVITGIDARGRTVTETKTEADLWDWETDNAFVLITSIIMTSRTGTGVGDTIDIGITDVLGLSNPIWVTRDVYKIKKNNADATVARAQVNVPYGTYDMSVIGLAATDDFTIWYIS